MTNTPTIYNAATLRQRFIDDMNLHRLSRAPSCIESPRRLRIIQEGG